jgi:CheY-like chemotaxis protein
VVVVDDDLPVRQGLQALLQAWGASVSAFDGLRAVQALAAGRRRAAPDLLIVDHRLGEGATGAQVVQALRARFARPLLPAIVVTGAVLEEPGPDAPGSGPGRTCSSSPCCRCGCARWWSTCLPAAAGGSVAQAERA